MPNGITVTGSPADIAAFIHKASVRQDGEQQTVVTAKLADLAKAKLSSAELNNLPDSAFAYVEPGGKKDSEGKTPPGRCGISHHDKAHADNAAARIAQGAKFGDKAKSKVEAAQRKFGEKKVSKEAGMTGRSDQGRHGPRGGCPDDGTDGWTRRSRSHAPTTR